MRIERLRLVGFKSFVEPAELAVHRGLTGIVGPNGCGKSNLLEAIRWAMGESSARSMRGAGMDDVIFAGTSTRPPRDFAEVALVCAAAADQLPPFVAGDAGADGHAAIEVVRRIERGTGSAYRVNGRDVRARDVALLFADAATGAHSPALVSQGKVAAIINARPQERRQLLEEAAGIAGLHVRRKDAEQKLRATEGNLARLAELLADMDTRVAALRRQARAAERYTRLTDDIRSAEARSIFARWRSEAAAADTAREAAQTAEAAVAAAQAALATAAQRQSEQAEALAKARSEAAQLREAELTLATRVQALRSDSAALTRRLADLEAESQRITRDRDAEDALSREGAAAIERLDAVARDAAATMQAATSQRPDLLKLAQHAADALRDAEVAAAHQRAERANEAAERRIAEAAHAEAERQSSRIAHALARIAADLAAAGDAPALAQRVAAADAATVTAQAELTAAEAAVAAAGPALDAARAAQSGAADAHEAARVALAASAGEQAALTRSLAHGSGGAAVMEAISVAPGYEQALAAALGDDASAPLLDAAAPAAERGWRGAVPTDDPALPADCDALARHVNAPAALARRLAQIIVAPTDDGQPLGPGQRLVTLDGALRRWDGFVSAGDGAAAAERLVRRNRLAVLVADAATLAGAASASAAALAAAQAQRDVAEAALNTARARMAAAERALRDAARDAASAHAALERFSETAAHLDGRRTELQQDAEGAAAELATTAAALAALPDGERGAAVLRAADDALALAMRQAEDVRARIAAIDSGIAAAREVQIEAQADARGWRARTGEAARRLAAMAAREGELARDADAIGTRPQEMTQALAEAEGALALLRSRLGEGALAEHGAEQALRNAEAALDESRETLAGLREARATAQARAEAADARRIDMGRLSGERFGCPPPLLPTQAGFAETEVGEGEEEAARHDRLTAERERIGPVNLIAAQELAEIEGTQATSAAEAEELQVAVNRLRGSIGHLNREGRTRLLEAFTAVDGHFQRLFTTLFGGGAAHLALTDSDDPLEAGLEIMAQPPGKKLASLTLLSGGEQALTALALIFALFLTNPAPICVLDEVDAPLDDANVERFCDLLDRMARDTDTRYLIVTHNAVTMARMHRLFGVTMVERGISRLVSVDLGGAEALLAAE